MAIIYNQSSYRQIFKATSVFGGVQVFSIILNLLKSKIIAIFLGPEGMGVYSLLQTPVILLSSITGLGINSSAVRDVAQINESKDDKELAKIVSVVRKWMRVAGFLGMLLTICLASQLSKWTFGNTDYTWAFYCLSVMLFFTALGNENDVILRGTRRIKEIAKAGIFSALFGLIFSVPVYYYWGIKGIPFTIIITALCVFLANYYYAKKVGIKQVSLSIRETYLRGKAMVFLGIMMVMASVVEYLAMFVVNTYVRSYGSIADVGLFQAGMQITNVSIGLVYTAMATDYFPRLSAICKNKEKVGELVNQQAEIAALISTPILIGMMIFTPLLIRLFLSAEFMGVTKFIHWILLAAVFRASTWTIHWVVLANGNSVLYFILVLITNILLLGCYYWGYNTWGLIGLGVGYCLMILINSVYMYLVISKKYAFKYTTDFRKIFIRSLLLSLACFIVIQFFSQHLIGYLIMGGILIIACITSWKDLNKRVKIRSYIQSRKNNK